MPRFTRLDELLRPGHYYLRDDDDCYFLWEYTAGQGYRYSDTNNLISNLKKPPSVRHRADWQYKLGAIQRVAQVLRQAFGTTLLTAATVVPIPPSKARHDPEHDDRLVQILRSTGVRDVRELIVQRESTEAGHTQDWQDRPGPLELQGKYEIDEDLAEPEPEALAVFDDLLRSGAHFKAVKGLLQARFPDRPILGLFIARVVPPPETP